MIKTRIHSLGHKKRGDVPCRLPLPHIHYTGTLHRVAEREQSPELILGIAHDIRKIGTLEAGADDIVLPEAELILDILRDIWRRCCRKCDYRHIREQFPHIGYQQIVRPEIVAPLGDAVRLVHHQETDLHLLHPGPEQVRAQPLRRQIQKLVIPVHRIVQRDIYLPSGHARVHGHCFYPPRPQILHLVLNQGDERRHHHRQSLSHHRRHLKTDRLASACRQNRKHVLSDQCGRYYLLLLGSERSVSPVFFQDFFHKHKDIKYSGKNFAREGAMLNYFTRLVFIN